MEMTETRRLPACFQDSETQTIVRDICLKHEIDLQLLEDLVQVAFVFTASRRDGLQSEVAQKLDGFLSRKEDR